MCLRLVSYKCKIGKKNELTHLSMQGAVIFNSFPTQLMEEIVQQESQSYKDRQLSFFVDNMEMKDFLTFYLESGQQITVCFEIENQQQENFVGQEEGCKQFVSLRIKSI